MNRLRLLYCLLFFGCTGFNLSAQEDQLQIPDSLKTKPFSVLKEQFYVYEAKDLRIAEIYAKTMLWLANKDQNASQIHQAQYYNARVSSSLGKKDTALEFVEKATRNSQKANDSTYIVRNIFLQGKIYADFGAYAKAIHYYLKARDLTKNDFNQTRFHMISHNIAIIKNQTGDVRNAIEISKRNLDYFLPQEAQNYIHIMNGYLLLASAYTKIAIEHQHDPTLKKSYIDSSFYYINKGFKEATAHKDTEAQALLTSSEGFNYYELNQFERALNVLKDAEKQSTELKLQQRFPMIFLFQGKSYYALGKYEKAIALLQKAMATSEAVKIDFPYLQETFIILAESYKAIGDIDNSIKYYELFHEKRKQNELSNAQNNTSLYEKYDIPSFEDQIRQLKNESARMDTKYTYVTYIAWSLLSTLLVIVFFYKKRQYQYKKRFEKLLVRINILEQEKVIQQKEKPSIQESSKKQLKIPDEKVKEVLKNLEKFEKKELFLKNNCTLNYVAKKVQTNSTYFSAILQQHKKKKFVQYITDLRIEYVLKRLKNDRAFRSYDIKSIGQEVGFNTAESFSKAFKKSTGIYPSFFIKKLDKLTDTSQKQ